MDRYEKALKRGNLESIQSIVEQLPFRVHSRDHDGYTTLILAARAGRLDVVVYLLAEGASINDQENKWRVTALYEASSHSKAHVIQHLLRSGADITLPNKGGWTPLMVAPISGKGVETQRCLLEHGGNDMNAINITGGTALHQAASAGFDQPELVARLLEAGADPTIIDKNGRTALDLARKEGFIDIAKTRLLEVSLPRIQCSFTKVYSDSIL